MVGTPSVPLAAAAGGVALGFNSTGLPTALTAKGGLFHVEAIVLWQTFTRDVTFLT